jgi:hypothetical protein
MSEKTEQAIITEGVVRLLSEGRDRVMFRRYTNEPNDVFAVFPDYHGTTQGHLTTYENAGQHSSGDAETIKAISTPVDSEHPDAKILASELKGRGYVLDPIDHTIHDKYLTNLKPLR